MNNEHKNTLNRTNKWKNQMNMKFIEFCYQRPAIDNTEKFVFLLSNPEVGIITSEYLNKALQIRTYLVEIHKQNG